MAKVWKELFDAMDAAPAEWVATTEEMYYAMLEAVPPQDMSLGMFLVGESTRHNARGEAVYACFKVMATGPVARYATQAEFNLLKKRPGVVDNGRAK